MSLATTQACDIAVDARPLVSIVVPAFNAVGYIDEAITSALRQSYPHCEIVVVDDASEDGTYERLMDYRDERLRIYRNPARLGQARNRNRALSLSRGQLVKFLDNDDSLAPTCVEEMVEVFRTQPEVALVFCRRRIVLPVTESAEHQSWVDKYGSLHLRYQDIGPVNHGPDMLAAWLRSFPSENWIGEPSAVMVRRACLERVGGFGLYLHQMIDWELWTRVMARGDVAFIDRELANYRYGHASESYRNRNTNRAWLDMLWTFEAMAADAELVASQPVVRQLLRAQRRQVWRTVAKGALRYDGKRVPVKPYRQYIKFRASRLFGRAPRLFAEISAAER